MLIYTDPLDGFCRTGALALFCLVFCLFVLFEVQLVYNIINQHSDSVLL